MMKKELFDSWIDRYDGWFKTDHGKFVKHYESKMMMEMLAPQRCDKILDIGCGTGIFTGDIIETGAGITGVDRSEPMLRIATHRFDRNNFEGLCCDMLSLPFSSDSFDRIISMTAIEFVEDAEKAIYEMNRVTKKGGTIVLTTLNSLSPWARRREEKAKRGHDLFENIFFRSPGDLQKLIPLSCEIKTCIHFTKDDPVDQIKAIEKDGMERGSLDGAFLAVKWLKSI